MLKLSAIRPTARSAGALLVLLSVLSLSGCGVAALPCRLTAMTLKIVPGVGHAAAAPFDTCANAID